MESVNTPDLNIKSGALQRINAILTLLDDLNINNNKNLPQKYNLYRSLFNNVAQFMTTKERDDTERAMTLLHEELIRYNRGMKSSFIYYADIFEREIRTFAHSKVKIGDSYG